MNTQNPAIADYCAKQFELETGIKVIEMISTMVAVEQEYVRVNEQYGWSLEKSEWYWLLNLVE